jgi:hypothetical protein
MKSLICIIHGREALPVRAIPYVAGRSYMAPDEAAKQLGRRIGAPFAKLQNTTAFHVSGESSVKIWPKEWDEIIAQFEALETRLKRVAPSDAEGYEAWLEQATPLLPAAVFVWRDEFEKDFQLDMENSSLAPRREGDDVLNFSPMLSEALQSIVLEKVPLPEAAHAQVVTEFTTSARPLRVDPALLALDATAQVKCADNIGGTCGMNWTTAGDYRAEIEARIKRQAEGFFTLKEAAQVLADAQPGIDAKNLTLKMRGAFDKKKLIIRDGNDRFPVLGALSIHDHRYIVKAYDIDAWLESCGVAYRFPQVATAESKAQSDTPAERRKNHDITSERGCRRLILEHWDKVEKAHGATADGRQVRHLIMIHKDTSETAPKLKTVQNKLAELRREKLIP